MRDKQNPLRLRAHHLLCYHAFSGKGYSEAFIKNMQEVKELFLSNHDLKIEIVAEPDCICDHCPHLRDTGCAKGMDLYEEFRIRELDRNVLKLSGFQDGQHLKVRDAFEAVEKVITSDILKKLCANCDWIHTGGCLEKISIKFFKMKS